MKSELASGQGLESSPQAREILSFEQAIALEALPLRIGQGDHGNELHVALADNSPARMQKISFVCGMEISAEIVSKHELDIAIPKAYRNNVSELPVVKRAFEDTQDEARPPLRVVDSAQGDISKFIEALLEFCAVRGASDLHLTPRSGQVAVRIRIDGQIEDVKSKYYDRNLHEQVLTRFKVRAGLDIAQKRLPQDGSFSFRVGNLLRNARVSIIPSLYGESVVLRILSAGDIPNLESLQMEPTASLLLRELLEEDEGMLLVTGPTGSGKTTTLYALAAEVSGKARNVVSVEDPIESTIAGVLQVQVAPAQSFGYPDAIRAVLRHDPDVLLIGEIRDPLSASIAVRASTTGHLSLSSLHVGSCLQVFRRLELLNVLPAHVVESVRLVLNQRLMPALCDDCKSIDSEHSSIDGRPFYKPNGCGKCKHSGFYKRVLITEVLDIQSRKAKDLILEQAFKGSASNHLPADIYMPWKHALEYHAQRGAISVDQVEGFVGGPSLRIKDDK